MTQLQRNIITSNLSTIMCSVSWTEHINAFDVCFLQMYHVTHTFTQTNRNTSRSSHNCTAYSIPGEINANDQ